MSGGNKLTDKAWCGGFPWAWVNPGPMSVSQSLLEAWSKAWSSFGGCSIGCKSFASPSNYRRYSMEARTKGRLTLDATAAGAMTTRALMPSGSSHRFMPDGTPAVQCTPYTFTHAAVSLAPLARQHSASGCTFDSSM